MSLVNLRSGRGNRSPALLSVAVEFAGALGVALGGGEDLQPKRYQDQADRQRRDDRRDQHRQAGVLEKRGADALQDVRERIFPDAP